MNNPKKYVFMCDKGIAILLLKKKPSVETEGYKPKPTAYEKKVIVL